MTSIVQVSLLPEADDQVVVSVIVPIPGISLDAWTVISAMGYSWQLKPIIRNIVIS
jgi:hypothetical protein